MRLLYWELTDSSFPSNAITGLAAVAAGLWFAHRRASAIVWILVGLWGFGRVYVGIHYPIDVLGGLIIGSACAMLSLALLRASNPVPAWLLRWARKAALA